MHSWKRFTCLAVVLSLVSLEAQAQIPGSNANNFTGGGAEFFVGRIEGKPLITVNLLDGVRLPGVYHIPVQTNMAQLFAYAGGLSEGDVDGVTVRNQKSGAVNTAKYDLEKIMDKNEAMPVLQDNDIVHVSMSRDALPRMALWVAIISAVASIVVTTVVIQRGK
jgi:hypothetical protein